MDFKPEKYNLPAAEIIPDALAKLKENNTLIISAPPGAGKSTLLPLAFLNSFIGDRGKILMLEPRRLAAKTIADRMSDMIDQACGQTIGYRIRFENKISKQTRIEVLTEGILTRIIQQDNELKGVSCVIFDEFHERSLNADLALALCRECQQIIRTDLKIIIMSATLDMPQLSKLLDAPVSISDGKLFPVNIIYTDNCDIASISEQASRTILKAMREHNGDVLAFLPGEAEIKKCEDYLKKSVNKNIIIHPLFGMLPQNKQYAAIVPDREGRRKIVLATSIAETSLTIEGIKIVVDSGFCRIQKYNPDTALSGLVTEPITKDVADQRTGRAGRLSEGVCYRMWTKGIHQQLKENRCPEIEYADLAQTVLNLAEWGESDALKLTWLTPPPKSNLFEAQKLLIDIDAIDQNYKITPTGKEINKIPAHPRIAHVMLNAIKQKLISLACDIAAVIENRDPMPDCNDTDINIRIEMLRRLRSENRIGKNFSLIEKTSRQYREMFDCKEDNSSFDSFDTGKLIASAYPERIASSMPGNNAQFMLSNGNNAAIPHTDSLAGEQWLAVASLNARQTGGKIFLASPLDPTDLKPLIKERESVSWISSKGGIYARKELRIGSIVLQSKPIEKPDREVIERVIVEAIKKEGLKLLNYNENCEKLQNRIASIKLWHKDEEWPDYSTSNLINTIENWLSPYLNNVYSSADLKKLNIEEILVYGLTPQQQKNLQKLAPTHIEMPTGSRIELKYQNDGSQPILEVRLQEVFGMADTPEVDNGKISVLMHLLSPGYKPVQVTSDLKSFWNNTYFDVKKELKSRYPKHVWPDDPWNEEPTRRAKRRGS